MDMAYGDKISSDSLNISNSLDNFTKWMKVKLYNEQQQQANAASTQHVVRPNCVFDGYLNAAKSNATAATDI